MPMDLDSSDIKNVKELETSKDWSEFATAYYFSYHHIKIRMLPFLKFKISLCTSHASRFNLSKRNWEELFQQPLIFLKSPRFWGKILLRFGGVLCIQGTLWLNLLLVIAETNRHFCSVVWTLPILSALKIV